MTKKSGIRSVLCGVLMAYVWLLPGAAGAPAAQTCTAATPNESEDAGVHAEIDRIVAGLAEHDVFWEWELPKAAKALRLAYESSGAPLAKTDDAARERTDAIVKRVVHLRDVWAATEPQYTSDDFITTMRYLVACYLSQPKLPADEQTRLDAQRRAIIEMLEEIPREIFAMSEFPDEYRAVIDDPMKKARQDVANFLSDPFHRFAQYPLSDEDFETYMSETLEYRKKTMTRDAQQFVGTQPNSPGALLRCSSRAKKVAFFTHVDAAREFAFAHLHNHSLTDDTHWYPCGPDKSYGITYDIDAMGLGILFRVRVPDTRNPAEKTNEGVATEGAAG